MENTQILNADGRPASYTYSLSLSFVHEDRDLSYISEKLGLAVERFWKKGDEYVRPNGSKTGFPRPKSGCGFSFSEENQTDLLAGLSAAIALLKPNRAFLHEVVDSGVEAYLSVGWFGREWNFGERLGWELIEAMADLKLSLDLDIYGIRQGDDQMAAVG